MRDSPIQTVTEVTDILQPSALTQRLDRRRTEPPGIIDVRQPQNLYSRTCGWLAQRFALLDELRFRYSGGDNLPGQDTGLVFATGSEPPSTEKTSAFSTAPHFSRPPEKPAASSTRSSTDSRAWPPEKFRVSRRATLMAANSPATASSGEKSRAESPAIGASAKPSSIGASEAEASFPSVAKAHLQRQHGEAATGIARGSEIKQLAASMPSQAQMDTSSTPATAAHVMHRRDQTETAIARSSEITPRAASQSSPALILPKRAGDRVKEKSKLESSVGLASNPPNSNRHEDLPAASTAIPTTVPVRNAQAQVGTSSTLAKTTRIQRRSGESASSLARSSELDRPLAALTKADLPLRKSSSGKSEEPPERPMVSAIEKAVENANGQPMAMAAEIPAKGARSSNPGMVWRKSASGSSASDLMTSGATGGLKTSLPLRIDSANGSAPAISRQATTSVETGSPANTETVVPAATGASTEAQASDVGQITEQVSRAIFRQLAVERERRGLGRWH